MAGNDLKWLDFAGHGTTLLDDGGNRRNGCKLIKITRHGWKGLNKAEPYQKKAGNSWTCQEIILYVWNFSGNG